MKPLRLSPLSSGFYWENIAERRRRMGIDDRERIGPLRLGRSLLPEILGDRAVELQAAHEPNARVLYFDFDLAEELGIEGIEERRLTPELEARLIHGLSWRVSKGGTLSVHADRYGGVGLGKSSGAGRAIILPWGNLVAHGVGETPLVSTDPDKFPMHRGAAPMIQAWSRAVRSFVYDETFEIRGERILAILDWNEYGVTLKEIDGVPAGARERRGVFIRAGLQFRPAHLLDTETGGGPFSLEVLLRGATAAGLEADTLEGVFDRAAERHARVQAQAMRHRILHGVLSTSNMQLDGGMLDVEASSAQPGTAPIMSMDFKARFGFEPVMDQFGFEHFARAHELQTAYNALGAEKPLQIEPLLVPRYYQNLAEELLVATGLMRSLVRALDPQLGVEFTKIFIQLTRLINPGNRNLLPVPRNLSVVKIFAALAEMPEHYFQEKNLESLFPISTADPRQEIRAKSLIRDFVSLWRAIMNAAEKKVEHYYDSIETFRGSVIARAKLSNADSPGVERDRLESLMLEGVNHLEKTGSAELLQRHARECMGGSLRSVDRLLRQGEHCIEGEKLITQRRWWSGARHELQILSGEAFLELQLPKTSAVSRIDVLWMLLSDLETLPGVLTTEGNYLRFSASLRGHRAGRVLATLRGPEEERLGEISGYSFVVPEREEREELSAIASEARSEAQPNEGPKANSLRR